jgi:hypothetical protein
MTTVWNLEGWLDDGLVDDGSPSRRYCGLKPW